MKKRVLYFEESYQVAVREESLKLPGAGQVLVQSIFFAISPGTELLVCRAQIPLGYEVDETIPALKGRFEYPMKYGYSVKFSIDKAVQAYTLIDKNPTESIQVIFDY
jgi:hypothetical protein